jgi:hypothetical protein
MQQIAQNAEGHVHKEPQRVIDRVQNDSMNYTKTLLMAANWSISWDKNEQSIVDKSPYTDLDARSDHPFCGW